MCRKDGCLGAWSPCVSGTHQSIPPRKTSGLSNKYHRDKEARETVLLHDAVFPEGFDGAHSLLERFSHELFPPDFLQCPGNGFRFNFVRDDEYAVNIAEQDIPRPNGG